MNGSTALLARLFFAGLLFFSLSTSAQKKVQKPIKLQAKTDEHKISLEMETDIFYFTAFDLLAYFKKVNDETTQAASNYLQNYHKEIAYKKGQTTFRNAGERLLHTAIEKHFKAILLSGKASDIQKEGEKMNLFILTTPCASDTSKQTITEKKGRVVLECL